jgi:hypothetical protein
MPGAGAGWPANRSNGCARPWIAEMNHWAASGAHDMRQAGWDCEYELVLRGIPLPNREVKAAHKTLMQATLALLESLNAEQEANLIAAAEKETAKARKN